MLPLPVPASVYGLVLLLAALNFGFVKLDDVKEVGIYLTGIFPLLFVPAAAGVMELWAEMGNMLLPILIAIMPGDRAGHGLRRPHHPGHDRPQKEGGRPMLNDFLSGSAAWGVLLTLAAFALGALINRITGKAIFNPLLLGSILSSSSCRCARSPTPTTRPAPPR